jgi:LysM repeat protein
MPQFQQHTLYRVLIGILVLGFMVGGINFNRQVVSTAHAQDGGSGCVNSHMVWDGQTLSELARRYNVDLQELAMANGIQNPSYIRIGDILCLDGLVLAQQPASGPNTGGPTESATSPASDGDRTESASGTGDTTNTNTNTDQVTDTTADNTESGTDTTTTNTTTTAAPAAPVSPANIAHTSASVTVGGRTYVTDNQGYYTVQTGDTMYRISLAFGATQSQIAALNGIPDVNLIYSGQRLIVPLPTPSRPVPGTIPAISLVSRQAGPGDSVVVQGYNYPPNATVELYLEKTSLNRRSQVLETVTTEADGTFEATVVIPATWTDGYPVNTRTVSISGRATDGIYWGMNFFINSGWSGQ